MVSQAKHATPEGFIQVSRERFYATVGRKDVHPRCDARSLKGRYFRSDWETPNRQRVGVSHSDSWGIDPTEYFALPAIAKAEEER